MAKSIVNISNMSGKLKGIQAINTNTLTNSFCQKMSKCEGTICSKCYSINMLETFRKNCAPSWQENSEVLSEGIIPEAYLPKFTSVFVRFSAHGELINLNHLQNFMNMCKKSPLSRFALWTKRDDIVNEFMTNGGEIPSNCSMVFSSTMIEEFTTEVPQHFDKVFNVVNVDNANEVSINCGAKSCMDCGLCYIKDNGVKIINELLK